MKKVILSILILGSIMGCKEAIKDEGGNQQSELAKTAMPTVKVEGKIFTMVDENPEFPGGIAAMYSYIGENLKYPQEAQRAGVEGKVFVKFVVTKDGKIGNIKTLKGIGFGCDEEVTRIISNMPVWKAGRNNNEPVNVYYTMPINFKMK